MVRVGAMMLAIFAIATYQLLDSQSKRRALDVSRLWAAALRPDENGAVTGAVDRLRVDDSSLLAVATIDPSGRIDTVYPPLASAQQIVAESMKRNVYPSSVTIFDGEKELPAWCVVTSMKLSGDAGSAGIALLLRREVFWGHWFAATLVFASGGGIPLLFWLTSLTRWFNRRVAGPLRNLADDLLSQDRPTNSKSIRSEFDWVEMRRIAERFRELDRALQDTRARAQRVEYEAHQRIRHREIGFDLQLKRARDQAVTDPLTGLRNRAFLDAGEFDRLVKSHRDARLDLTVVVIDLDNFKHHNDTYGHQEGDELLRFIGELLRATIRPEDLAVRLGGDEFVLILPETGPKGAATVADRIVKLFAQYASRFKNEKPLSLSAGLASLSDGPGDCAKALLTRADSALYAAKRKGKNGLAVGVR